MKSALGIQGNIPLQAGLHPHKGHVGSDRFSPAAAKSLKGCNEGSTEGEAFPDRGGKPDY